MQAMSDVALQALTCLVTLRELSLSGAVSLSGRGFATLKGLPPKIPKPKIVLPDSSNIYSSPALI